MDDPDDYFADDLVLDEQIIAALDRAEQKYLSQVQQPAVTKRLKTKDGWWPGIGSRVRDEEDYEDLPEISITADGTYGISNSATRTVVENQQIAQSSAKELASNPTFQRQPLPIHSTTYQARTASVTQSHHPRTHTYVTPSRSDQIHGQSDLKDQLTQLQEQLQELREQNQKIQEALKEATEVRYAKEGEVTILRKNLEKSTQNHAAELAKLKAAKDEADARKTQLERQFKEETERLKTQFIFKQHELEASLRRPPGTLRSTTIMKNIPTTPRRNLGLTQNWGESGIDPNQNLHETPVRPSHRQQSITESPKTDRLNRKSPEKSKKPAILPGFQNSFVTSPLKLFDANGRSREIRPQPSFENLITSTQRYPSLPDTDTLRSKVPKDGWEFGNDFNVGMNSDDLPVQPDEDGDAVMLDSNVNITGDVEPIRPRNRKAELSRILLNHVYDHANETTIQMLTNLPSSLGISNIHTKQCMRASQSILSALTNPIENDFVFCSRLITRAILSFLYALSEVEPCLTTAALFNLLASVTISLPEIIPSLLSSNPEDAEEATTESSLLGFTCRIARQYVPGNSDKRTTILYEIFSFLEVVCLDVPDILVSRLNHILQLSDSLQSLFNGSEPSHLLEKTSRMLTLLATYQALHPQFTSLTEETSDSPLLKHLCLYLINCQSTSFPEVIFTNILTIIAQISLTQLETLGKSYTMIPSVVFFVSHLTSMLWNDDERTLISEEASSLVRTINQCLFLLQHLVYGINPNVNLHDKLQHAPGRDFNILIHMFIISFGQLSYSDPPHWLKPDDKAELEGLAGIAKELLDLVVDGPEGDGVWEAYQMEVDEESETDDEEREARLLEDMT